MNALSDFLFDSVQISKKDELLSSFIRYIEHYEMNAFTTTTIQFAGREAQEHNFGDLYNYPEEWIELYAQEGYGRFDPVYNRGMSRRGLFSWSQALDEFSGARSDEVMFEASNFGLCNGMGFSIIEPNGFFSASAWAARRGEFPMILYVSKK